MAQNRKRAQLLPDLPLADTYGYDPKLVLAGDGDPALGRLLLVMALAYNDLKGASHLAHLLKPITDKTIPIEPAIAEYGEGAVGEVGGVSAQVARLFAGILHELMVVLKEHRETIESERFRRLLRSLPKTPRAAWDRIWTVATKQDAKAPALKAGAKPADVDSHVLLLLRNNLAFHYGVKTLANGFRAFFIEDAPSPLNAAAVFSDGVDMSSTRFHFADAAATRAVGSLLDAQTEPISVRIAKIGQDVNFALRYLILGYLARYCGTKRRYRYGETP